MSYFDSAYIAKFYVDEPDSESVRSLAETLGRVHCCALGRLEVAGVFHRKWREGAFTEREFREVSAQFSDDCALGLWTWFSVTDRLIASASESLRTLNKGTVIRSADALHLVCAKEHGMPRLYTSDRHMIQAAKAFGIEALSI